MDPEEMNSILLTNKLAIESMPASNKKFQSRVTPEVEQHRF